MSGKNPQSVGTLQNIRNSSRGDPLSYLVRGYAEVTQEMLDATYEDMDVELITTTQHGTPTYIIDKKRLHVWLHPLLHNGPAWPHVSKWYQKKDGFNMYHAAECQAIGPAARTLHKNEAYQMVGQVTYSGKGKQTYDQFIARQVRAHNILEREKKPFSETKKVADLLVSITDPRLAAAIDIINGNEAKLASFKIPQNYIGTLLVGAKKHKTSDQRRIVGLNQGNDGDLHSKTKNWNKDSCFVVDKVGSSMYRKYPSSET